MGLIFVSLSNPPTTVDHQRDDDTRTNDQKDEATPWRSQHKVSSGKHRLIGTYGYRWRKSGHNKHRHTWHRR